MFKFVTMAAATFALAVAPAFAATHFYVAHPPHSKRCTIVEKRPDGKNLILVGKPHSTKSAATKALHTSVSCTSTGKGS